MSNMDWPLFYIKQTQLHSYWHTKHGQFQTALCVTARSHPQSPCCTQTALRFGVLWHSLGFCKAFVDIVLGTSSLHCFLTIKFFFSILWSLFYSWGPTLSWLISDSKITSLSPPFFLPAFPINTLCLISIWASLLGKSTRKERWWAEGIGEDSASHAIDVGVPSVGSQAISNGAVFVSQKRLEEGIRNLSSGFAMGLRRGSTPTASHGPTFRALSVSGNRHPPQPRLCCTSTEPGISSLVTNHS